MKLLFVTINEHKFIEAKMILEKYGIELVQKKFDYAEDHELGIEGIAKKAAKDMAEKFQEPVIVEDTGIFFNAYPGFPGQYPKFVMKTLGYEGILKLLDGKDRTGYAKTFIGFCEPGQQPMLFEGTMNVTISEQVNDLEKESMDYDRIMIPENQSKPISSMTKKEKNGFSQRAKAFEKLGKFFFGKGD